MIAVENTTQNILLIVTLRIIFRVVGVGLTPLFYFCNLKIQIKGLPGGSEVKASACNAGDMGSIPGSDPWVGKIPWGRKWQPTPVFLPGRIPWTEEPGGLVHGIAKSWTRLSDFTRLGPHVYK